MVLRRNTKVSQQLKICPYYSMNKLYVEGLQKWKKSYLIMSESKMAIDMCLYYSMAGA